MPKPTLTILPDHLGRNGDVEERPPTLEAMREAARAALLEVFEWVLERALAEKPPTFKEFEGELRVRLRTVGRLLVMLFLRVYEERVSRELEPVTELGGQRYRRRPAKARNLMTEFGVVRYWRTYLRALGAVKGRRRGFHPLDTLLGLAADRFSIGVASLGAYLATKMSFTQARECLVRTLGEAPSTEALERAVLGLGAHADQYFEQAPPPGGDGEVLVIQIDGKGIPTATADELARRRGKRPKGGKKALSARHRGRARRGTWRRKRRHPGEAKDLRKNAKVAFVVVMYTLLRGADGLLHGPLNKRVWATFAGKKEAFAWARRQAHARGFDPASARKLIQLVTDGDEDFARIGGTLFPHAVHTIDIMHVLEYVWDAGKCMHKGDDLLRPWAARQKRRLLKGEVDEVIAELDQFLERKPLPKASRKTVARSRDYILGRRDKLDYAWLRGQDLEIGSGAVEGAVNHLVALRFDHGGMRWIRERAEPLLKLRCIAFNGDWDAFIDYVHDKLHASARNGLVMPILRNSPEILQNPARAA